MPLASTVVKVLYDAAHRMPTYVSLAAVVGCLFLIVLYLSQRRDLVRIQRGWRRSPNHPAEDMARSEALLDRAEAELEEILGVEAPHRADRGGPTDGGGTRPELPDDHQRAAGP